MHTLYLISGNSGSGKTTVMRALMDSELVSFTTRPPRPKEVEGKDYHFISLEQFFEKLNNNELIEWTKYGDNYYGMMASELKKLDAQSTFCIVDFVGVEHFTQLYEGKVVTIFLYTTLEECIDNLKRRGESDEFIAKRTKTYYDELDNSKYYDYVIKSNYGSLNELIEIVRNIIESEEKHG